MSDVNLVLKDLVNGGELINLPGTMQSSGVVAFGVADRVPVGNRATLVLLSVNGGAPVNVPVTIQDDGRVIIGTAPDTSHNVAYLNASYNGAPILIEAAIASNGTLTINGATFENPDIAPVYDFGEIGNVGTTTVAIRFSIPVASTDFTDGVTIKKNTVSQTISSGTLQADGVTVYYVITPAADANDTVTWEYAKSGGDIASEFDGTELENVSAQTVTNNIAAVPPLYVSSEIGTVDATTVAVTFSTKVAAAGNDFSTGVIIKKNTVSQTISSGTRQADHHIVYYVITPAADANDVLTWEYNGATGHITNEDDGGVMASKTPATVTNNIAGVAPTFTSAEVGTVNATTVAATFSVDLSATGDDYETGFTIEVDSTPVAIGTATRQSNHAIIYFTVPAVTNGQTVTIAYAAPAGVILNEADGTPMVTFTAQSVTNNVA